MSVAFRFPPGDSRTVVIGASGSGKSTFGAWLLSHVRFDKRPWVVIDYKKEEFYERLPRGAIRPLKLGRMPDRRGLYLMNIQPGMEEETNDWFWNIWKKGNVGIFADEASLLPKGDAFKAILRQGRSKRIPVIALTQRPVDVQREIFSEANYYSLFRLNDRRDYKVVEGFVPIDSSKLKLAEHHSIWYDAGRNALFHMRPVPQPEEIAAELAASVPRRMFF